MMNKKQRDDYTALKSKLFSWVLVLSGIAVLLVFVFRSISVGKCADLIVKMIGSILLVDRITATNIYVLRVRNYMELILVIFCILLFLAFFRFFLNAFTRYLEKITLTIEALTHDSGTEIRLPKELCAIENKLQALQQTIERKETQAKQSTHRKNDLLIYSAHDIKTPLTSVLGYLILLNGNPNLPREDREKYTSVALDKTRELDGMINELFEITRYNLNEIELQKTWINLYDMLSEIKEEHYPELKAGGKQVELSMASDIRLYGDADKLARVFNNILRNAMLYSKAETTITISTAVEENRVEVAFENICDPITETKLNRLFAQFYRGEEAKQSNPTGSGLGLAIAKEIVSLHGGTIQAESTKYGIRFVVKLPAFVRDSMKEP